MIPLEAVVTKVQMASPEEPTGFLAVLRGLVSANGILGLYAGVQAYVVGCLQPAFQFSLFERFKKMAISYQGGNPQLSLATSFMIGAVTKAIAATIVQPVTRARILAQSAEGPPPGMASSILRIWRDDGFFALFRGLEPELTQGVLSAALMMMVKEQIQGGVKKTLMSVAGGSSSSSSSPSSVATQDDDRELLKKIFRSVDGRDGEGKVSLQTLLRALGKAEVGDSGRRAGWRRAVESLCRGDAGKDNVDRAVSWAEVRDAAAASAESEEDAGGR